MVWRASQIEKSNSTRSSATSGGASARFRSRMPRCPAGRLYGSVVRRESSNLSTRGELIGTGSRNKRSADGLSVAIAPSTSVVLQEVVALRLPDERRAARIAERHGQCIGDQDVV